MRKYRHEIPSHLYLGVADAQDGGATGLWSRRTRRRNTDKVHARSLVPHLKRKDVFHRRAHRLGDRAARYPDRHTTPDCRRSPPLSLLGSLTHSGDSLVSLDATRFLLRPDDDDVDTDGSPRCRTGVLEGGSDSSSPVRPGRESSQGPFLVLTGGQVRSLWVSDTVVVRHTCSHRQPSPRGPSRGPLSLWVGLRVRSGPGVGSLHVSGAQDGSGPRALVHLLPNRARY